MADTTMNRQKVNPSVLPQRLLTPSEVADRLRVSIDWVQAHASGRKQPKLPCRRLGKLIRFLESDLQAFLEQQATAEPPSKPERFKVM